MRRRVTRQVAIAALLATSLVTAVTLGSGRPAQGTEDLFLRMGVQRPATPGPAPDLRLPSLDGKTVHLKDFGGKVVLLGFFTTT